METREEKTKEIHVRTQGPSFYPEFWIPFDLTREILVSLPPKSLMRFRCVSKQWASVTSDRDFIDSFTKQSSTCLMLSFQKKDKLLCLSIPQQKINLETTTTHVEKYHLTLQEVHRYAPTFQFQSVHGLISFHYFYHVVVWNPSVGKNVIFHKTGKLRHGIQVYSQSYLGYDPIGNTYKILSMSYASTEDTYVLTLRAGESWRQIIDIPKCFLSCKGICINGILFIVGIDGKGKKILSFDVRTENFKIIQTHSCMLCDDEVEPNPSLVSYKGKLAWVISESTSYRLWILEDTEKAEWSCQDFHIPFSLEDPVVKDNYFLSDVTEDGEFIYVSVSWQDKEIYVSYYDPKRKTHTRRIKIEHLDEDDDFWLRNGSCRDDWKFLGTLTNHIGNLMPLNTFPTCPPSGARLNKYMCTKVNAGLKFVDMSETIIGNHLFY